MSSVRVLSIIFSHSVLSLVWSVFSHVYYINLSSKQFSYLHSTWSLSVITCWFLSRVGLYQIVGKSMFHNLIEGERQLSSLQRYDVDGKCSVYIKSSLHENECRLKSFSFTPIYFNSG